MPTAGDYTAWLGGDWFGLASISVDGRKVGSMREELDWPGLYTDLGSVPLSAGEHLVRIRYETGGWHPGSGGTRTPSARWRSAAWTRASPSRRPRIPGASAAAGWTGSRRCART